MLSQRKKEILNYLYKEQTPTTVQTLCQIFNLSTRTMQNTLKETKDEINVLDCGMFLHNERYKGYWLTISNDEKAEKMLNTDHVYTSKSSAIKFMLKTLLLSNEYIQVNHLSDELYLSPATAYSYLTDIKEICSGYNLSIISSQKKGTKIAGSEIDKRNCLIKEGLINFHSNTVHSPAQQNFDKVLFNHLSFIASKCLVEYKYRITDIVFENFLMHLFISINRMISGHFIDSDMNISIDSKEHEVVEAILQESSKQFHFTIAESEIDYLAYHLKGKNSYDETDYIPEKINILVNEILLRVQAKTGLDLSYSLELRVSLSLHLSPLITRLQNGNQLSNSLTADIKNSFPYAFELGNITASYLAEKFGVSLIEDEVSYLALHFNVLLSKDTQSSEKKILIIASSRRSDSLLIKNNLYQRFSGRISDISVLNVYELSTVPLNQFDIVFSTTLSDDRIPANAIHINYFLTENDYDIIQFALDHGSLYTIIAPYFRKKSFISNIDSADKSIIIQQLCNSLSDSVNTDDLYQAVMHRELGGYTSYENLIALPHPDRLIANGTFVAVAILKKPMIWSENNSVQLIMLLCANQHQQGDLRILFDVVSRMQKNKAIIDNIIDTPTYENFIRNLKRILETSS